MKISQLSRNAKSAWTKVSGDADANSDLVLYFGAPNLLSDGRAYNELRERFGRATIVGCSTGGEITGREVCDDTIIASALKFTDTRVKVASVQVGDHADSADAGEALVNKLKQQDLRHIFVLSDGLSVNGTGLISGIRRTIADEVGLSGGLAGDGDRFKQTFVGADGTPASGTIAAIGFYGDKLVAQTGSVGGWEPFGPERVITRARDNILYELDGQPALELYRKYLGDEAKGLPGTALLFPLAIRPPNDQNSNIVRTIVGIDDAAQSMIFAGDIPQGHIGRLMRGGYDNLVAGAEKAAVAAHQDKEQFAILVSCIGRKLMMGPHVSEEVEAVGEILGPKTILSGFYSYGELAPHSFTGKCELHNQTMTVTTLSELN